MTRDGIYDGMAHMTHRTTFALDENTAKRLRKLSKMWKVSQAEVVRRALREAEHLPAPQSESPADRFRAFHQTEGGLVREQAAKYLAEVEADRKQWRSS